MPDRDKGKLRGSIFVGFMLAGLFLILASPALANTLYNRTTVTTAAGPYAIAVDDLDGDGAQEMVTANFRGNSISVFKRGAAGWSETRYATTGTYEYSTGHTALFSSSNPCAVAVGDVTNDGRKDVVVSDEWNHRIMVYPGNATGLDQATKSFSTGNIFDTHPWSNPYGVVIGDFNGDTLNDIAIANYKTGETAYEAVDMTSTYEVDFNDGGVTHTLFNTMPKAPAGVTVSISGTLIFEWRRNNTWAVAPRTDYHGAAAIYSGANFPSAVEIPAGRVRIRWYSDATCSTAYVNLQPVKVKSQPILVLQQAPGVSGMSCDKFDYLGYGVQGEGAANPVYPYSVVAGDYNHDGHVHDLALCSYYGDKMYAYLQNYQGYLVDESNTGVAPREMSVYDTGKGPLAIASGELNGHAGEDIVVSEYGRDGESPDKMALFLQNKTGRYDARIEYDSQARPMGVTVGDINDDGRQDVAVANSYSDSVSIYTQKPYLVDSTGSSAFTRPLNDQKVYGLPDKCAMAIANGDLDGDGYKDVVVTSSTQDKLMIMEQELPDAPSISSAGGGSFSGDIVVDIEARKDLNGITAYYYVLDRNAGTVPTAADTKVSAGAPDAPVRLTISKPADGLYYLHVVSQDAAGHVGTSAAHSSICIDTTGPTAPMPDDGIASGSTTSSNVTFTWRAVTELPVGASSGLKGYYYKLDGGSETLTTLLTTPAIALSDGNHTLYVRAADNAGNSSTTGYHQVYVDSTPPTITSLSLAYGAASTNTTACTLYVAGAGSPTEMRVAASESGLASATWLPFSTLSTFTLNGADGVYWAYVQLRDVMGNVSTVGSDSVLLDRVAPSSPAPDDLINGLTNSSTVSFSWTACSDGVSTTASGLKGYYYSIDLGGETFTDSPLLTLQMTEGTHAFYVRSRDEAGNYSAYGKHTLTIDVTKPVISSLSIAGGSPTTNTTATTLDITCTGDPTLMRFSNSLAGLDTAVWIAFKSTAAFTLGSSSGTNIVYAQTRDEAGNLSAYGSDSITIDMAAPTAPDPALVLADGNAPETVDTVYGEVGGVEGNSIVSVFANAGLTTLLGKTTATSSGSFSPVAIGDNLYGTVYVTVTDQAGNRGPAQAINNDIVGPTAPTIWLSSTYYKTKTMKATVGGSTDDMLGVYNYEYMVCKQLADGYVTLVHTTPTGQATGATIAAAADCEYEGKYDLYVRAWDKAFNLGGWTKSSFYIDTTKPTLIITAPKVSPVTYLKGVYVFNTVAKDSSTSIAYVDFYIDGKHMGRDSYVGTNNSFGLRVNTASLKNGLHGLKAIASDEAGNKTVKYGSFYTDNTRPVVRSLIVRRANADRYVAEYRIYEGMYTQCRTNLSVYNSSGTRVLSRSEGLRFASPQGTRNLSIWNGRYASGKAVPDGTYRVCIAATDKAGNTTLRMASYAVRVYR